MVINCDRKARTKLLRSVNAWLTSQLVFGYYGSHLLKFTLTQVFGTCSTTKDIYGIRRLKCKTVEYKFPKFELNQLRQIIFEQKYRLRLKKLDLVQLNKVTKTSETFQDLYT